MKKFCQSLRRMQWEKEKENNEVFNKWTAEFILKFKNLLYLQRKIWWQTCYR